MSYASKVIIGDKTHLVGSNLYGTCNSEASAVTKVVILPDFDKFLVGVTIHVRFANTNTAVNPTMNVNNLGAKPIYVYGSTPPGVTADTSWDAGAILSFTYDGVAWVINDWIKANTGVKQLSTGADSNVYYRILLSSDSTNTTKIAPTRKSPSYWYNPSLQKMHSERYETGAGKYYAESPTGYGLHMMNSDIVGCNAIWFNDPVDGFEGIMFKGTQDNKWDNLYCKDGVLYVERQCTVPVDEEGTIHNVGGTTKKILSEDNMVYSHRIRGGTVSKLLTANNNNWAVVFTDSDVNQILGVNNSTSGNTCISVANGHYQACPHVIDGVAYDSNRWYVHFVTRPSSSFQCRVNYIIYYWG